MVAGHHSDGHPVPVNPFPDSEWAALRQSDIKAAWAIVVLMLGIFVTGIVLYTWVLVTL